MASADKPKTARILLGEITGAHGLRGEVSIRTFTATPDAIAIYGALEDECGARKLEISVKRVTDSGVIASITGISDRSAAEALKGTQLYVDRARLPPAADGEYYYADLIGLTAVSSDGTEIGKVTSIANYGAGDILEVRIERTGKSELIPMLEGFVPRVDLANKRIEVVLPISTDDETD
jgi:16S rRNA processing protein RimM